jgi:uncharacterized membrane protein YhhN
MNILLIAAFAFAVLASLAVWKGLPKLEYFAKPAVMVCLFAWLWISTRWNGTSFWFGLGILFSMVGDVLLMSSPDRMFLYGLIAFLLTHIAYIAGFKNQFMRFTGESFFLVVILAVITMIVARRIIESMRAKGEHKLIPAVVVYAAAISLMVFAAFSTIFDPAWKRDSALLVVSVRSCSMFQM